MVVADVRYREPTPRAPVTMVDRVEMADFPHLGNPIAI